MFSGIVQQLGTVKRIAIRDNIKIFYIAFENCSKCSIGDSVAINGTCLTVTDLNLEHIIARFDAVPETLDRTNLNELSIGDIVNTELAIRYGDLIGGHTVQGHIDEKGSIKEIKDVGGAWIVEIIASKEFLEYLIPKGFVAIDGMSITVVEVFDKSFTVTLIPHTIDTTIAKNYTKNSVVNLEADATGKYIYKYLQGFKNV
ncbi:riboflavin synthase [Allofrancisella guangzhouensis]|uniref:Riboflavin synthase n=1 Tax=Allofrancisella guangzhouensis TaxID=594679 RepID=A0A0A8E2V6_9GAMM|nr:riboflavin synthase [Allofrancisella guangzhouensis]AJC48338.1 riboflavin synthase subunit alpha [Allofrancisella guangzhouensis]MBK2026572.1 riboflavin synthase [Allofrancisella guangzhouensis]MBK2044316.1 riboflavin synthase [Allofrancisella guangzhouensis]MBK2045559.1 riboflavin synthase [Allofrancisella guangzhouensis]